MAKKKTEIPIDNDWQTQSDADTLKRAHEITNDLKRHEAAKKHAMKEMEVLKKISKSKSTTSTKGSKKK